MKNLVICICLLALLAGCETANAPGGSDASVNLSADVTQGQAPFTVNLKTDVSGFVDDALTYRWDFGQGTRLSGNSSRVFTYRTPNTYTVTVEVSDGVRSAADSVEITVDETINPPGANQSPLVDLVADSTAGGAPLTVVFRADAADLDGDLLAYAWSFGDGTFESGSATRTHTYSAPGTYEATVTVSDGQGGVESSSETITVQ